MKKISRREFLRGAAASSVIALVTPLGVNAESAGGEITIATVSSTGGLDPAGFALDMWTEYAKLCTDGLVSYDSDGSIIYESAESYEISDDNLVWTFHLREDAKWSDGSAVTAADFVNTIQRALDPNNGNAIYANMLYNIVGAEEYNTGDGSLDDVMAVAVDDYTLQFTLDQPCSYFLKMMSMPVFYPSKAGLATNDNESWYKDPSTSLGNGAFCLESYTEGVGYSVVKNEYYYQADKVGLDRITVQFISDQTALLSAYQTGEVNVVTGLPDYVQDQYTEETGLFIWTMLTSKFILPNLSVAPLDDERVREAIALALNREEICSVIGSDYIASVNYVAEYMLSTISDEYFKDEQDPLFTEDEERAKELLSEAGYPDGEGFPTLTYKYPNSEKDSLMAQAIQAQLKSVLNIDIELVGEEDEVYAQEKKDGSYELIRHSWTADYNDPINFLNLYTSDSTSNYNGVADEDFDTAISNSDLTTDVEERNQYLHDAQNILVSDNFYVIPVVTQVYICLIDPSITGVTTNDKGEPMYRFAALNA
ncbi:MAG: peptide ABC transporter substrate-binding protein [Lachnospiraceae bacterium]|nr:peptide ABC transporter substrate-binding protein [Lachnospiraceae bacterium]